MKDMAGEYLDLTDLQKRGLLKIPKEKEEEISTKTDQEGYVDLGGFGSNSGASSSSYGSPESDTSVSNAMDSPFGMLDSLASSAEPSPNVSSSNLDNKEVQHLKVKIEDLEYKLDRFMERLEKLEENSG